MSKQNEIINYLMSAIQVLLLAIAGWATSEIRDATKSINELNITMAGILAETANQKKSIERLDDRVDRLERISR